MISLAEKLKDNFHGICGTIVPAGGLAFSLTGAEQFLRVGVLAVTFVTGCVSLYFLIRKNRQ